MRHLFTRKESGEIAAELLSLRGQLAKVGRNWSSGMDEEFGGRFVCIHGLSEEEAKAFIAAGKAALALTGNDLGIPAND